MQMRTMWLLATAALFSFAAGAEDEQGSTTPTPPAEDAAESSEVAPAPDASPEVGQEAAPAPEPGPEEPDPILQIGKEAAAIIGTGTLVSAIASGVIVYGLIHFTTTVASLDPMFVAPGIALIVVGVIGTPAAIAGGTLLAAAVTSASFVRAVPAVVLATIFGVAGLGAGYALYQLSGSTLAGLSLPFAAELFVPTALAVGVGAVGGAVGAALGYGAGFGIDFALHGLPAQGSPAEGE